MRILKPMAISTLVVTLCILPTLTAEEKLELPGAKPTAKLQSGPAVRVYPWERPAAQHVRAQLGRPCPDVRFNGVAFEQCVAMIRDMSRLTIVVNWSALETAAIESDAEITLEAQDITVGDLLGLTLEEIGAGEVDLAFEIERNYVRISTREDLARRAFVHIYPIRELLDLGTGPAADPEERYTQVARLISTIQETVDPESWRSAGGNVGAINDYCELLIVTQTQSAHEQIWDLLENIRSALKRPR